MIRNRKLLAVMFTDIVGYTSMSSENEKKTLELVENCNRLLKVYVKMFRGKWLKQVGDGTLTTFESAYDAVRCAVHIQQTFGRGDEVQLRVGIHIGDVVEKDGDVWGDGVNIASRTEGKAPGGGIAVTESVQQALVSHPDIPFEEIGDFEFKGAGRSLKVFSVPLDGVAGPAISEDFADSPPAETSTRQIRRSVVFLALIAVLITLGWYVGAPRSPDTLYVTLDTRGEAVNRLEFAWYFGQLEQALDGLIALDVIADEGADAMPGKLGIVLTARREGEDLLVDWHIHSDEQAQALYSGSFGKGELELSVFDSAARLLAWVDNDERFSANAVSYDPTAINLYFQAYTLLTEDFTPQIGDNAEGLLHSALALEPDLKRASALLCRINIMRQSFFQDAEGAWLTKAQSICTSLVSDAENDPYVSLSLASFYSAKGQFETADMFLNKHADESLDWFMAKTKLLARQGDFTGALSFLQKVTDLHVLTNWRIHMQLASLHIFSGDCPQAIREYEIVLSANPDAQDAQLNLASCYFNLGQLDKANALFGMINAKSPNSYTLNNQGTAFYYLGDYRRAEDNYQQALLISPNDYEIHGNLADTLLEIVGAEEQARNSYLKAVSLAKAEITQQGKGVDPLIYLMLGHYLSQLNDYVQAEVHFSLYKSLLGEDAEYYYYKAISSAKRGESHSSAVFIEEALALAYPLSLIKHTPILEVALQAVPDEVLENYSMR